MASAESVGSAVDQSLRSKMPAIGIDLGGTKLSAAIVVDFKVVSEPLAVATPSGADNIVEAIISLILRLQQNNVVAGAGIATAGVVDPRTGDIVGSTGNLPGWTGTPLKKIIEGRTMLPVTVDNDANAAAYGDAHQMRLNNEECVVGVTLGTGIGTGIIIKGEVFRGSHLAAGEGGHIRIALDNKRFCTCGLFDCWEEYGSGRGLVQTAREVLAGVSASQSTLVGVEDLQTRMITAAAAEGDMAAQKALNIWHEHVATGIASLMHLFDPAAFIISGGLSQAVDFDLLKELAADRCMPRYAENLRLYKSELGNYAGIIGAASAVVNQIAQKA